MIPYYADDFVTIYHGDARELLPAIAYDVIVTDPPYGVAWEGGNMGGQKFGPIAGDGNHDAMSWALGLDGPRVVFGADHAPWAVPPGGTWSVWDKRSSDTSTLDKALSADRIFGSPFEMVWASWQTPRRMFRCLHTGTVNADRAYGKQPPRVHPTQKPVVLLADMLELWVPEGQIVADPFMGSGTTLRAAKHLGRKAVGIEVEERFCEVAATRMTQELGGWTP